MLFVDSVAAASGGAAAVSSNTTYIESAAGIGEGARTGLSSIVVGMLFLASIALAPLIAVIPANARIQSILLDALGLLAGKEYELVVSDITMPGMSGLDMIPHVKSSAPNTVVVMISGMQTVESAIDALRLGAFDYVMKPFDLRQVEAVVKRALWSIRI